MILTCAALLTACGDDGSANEAGSGTAGSGATAGNTDGTSAATDDPPGTSSGQASDTESPTTGVVDSSGTGPGTDTEEETDTAGVDCTAIIPGPLAVDTIATPGMIFSDSEDIAFDGQGNLAGKSGGQIVLIDSTGTEVDSWPDQGGTYGLRYRTNGDLLAAKFMVGNIAIVNGEGNLLTNAGGVNGLYPDLDGNVWVTNFSSVRRINGDDSVDDIITGGDAGGANGVVYDPERGILFFTGYNAGEIRAAEIAEDGSAGPVSVVSSIGGALLDGLSMDACGNLYVVDQGNSALYRVFLDEAGVAMGDAETLVAQFPANVANAVFAPAASPWGETTMYASGVPGGLYAVEIGVPGAAYALP